jgi:hypothetical protein
MYSPPVDKVDLFARMLSRSILTPRSGLKTGLSHTGINRLAVPLLKRKPGQQGAAEP